MKLNQLYNLPLKEALEKMELAEMKVHTDDGGSIKAIELKYTCGNQKQEPEQKLKRASYSFDGMQNGIRKEIRMGKFDNVKPGYTVYCFGGDEDTGEGYSGFLFMAVCNGYVIVCPEYSGLENDFEGQLQEMCEESLEESGVDVYIFPEGRFFLTAEGAEGRLRQ